MRLFKILILLTLKTIYKCQYVAGNDNLLRRRSQEGGGMGETYSVQEGEVQQRGLQNECFRPDLFEAEVLLKMSGLPDLVTPEEIKLVQDKFVESYNRLTEGLCDDQFRVVQQIRQDGSGLVLEPTDSTTRRNLQVKKQFAFRFFVLGACRGCPKRSRIFNDGFRRALFADENPIQVNKYFNRDLQFLGPLRFHNRRPRDLPNLFLPPITISNPLAAAVSTNNPVNRCNCAFEPPTNRRAPGNDEFQQDYNQTISQLVVSGDLIGVGEILGIEEIETVTCSRESLDNFKSEVILQLVGNPDGMTQVEKEQLIDLFLKVYEVTNEQFCDPYFRKAIAAEIVDPVLNDSIDGGRSRKMQDSFGSTFGINSEFFSNLGSFGSFSQASASRTSLPTPAPTPAPVISSDPFRPFQFRLVVRGTCRGCPSESRIFDDGLRRRLGGADSFESVVMKNRDLVQSYTANGENVCTCPQGSEARGPSEDFFLSAFSEALAERKQLGEFPNINEVSDAIQVDETEPSSTPSVMPSMSPSTSLPVPINPITPTPETPEPTTQPTTFRPSDGPSESPTRPTRPTDSPVPSPSPSIMPSFTQRPTS